MWNEVNGTNKFDSLKPLDDVSENQRDEWEDMEEVEDDTVRRTGVQNLSVITDAKLVVVDQTAPAPSATTTEVEDEIDKIT